MNLFPARNTNVDRKVRVFISSTFRDMHAERDHFVTLDFPELRERCKRLGLELNPFPLDSRSESNRVDIRD